jgi:hypothetical protein
MRKGR